MELTSFDIDYIGADGLFRPTNFFGPNGALIWGWHLTGVGTYSNIYHILFTTSISWFKIATLMGAESFEIITLLCKCIIFILAVYKKKKKKIRNWVFNLLTTTNHKLTSSSLAAWSMNNLAHSSTSLSFPAWAASININSGTVVSKNESETWSTTARRNWRKGHLNVVKP